jgi:hypothetical protein
VLRLVETHPVSARWLRCDYESSSANLGVRRWLTCPFPPKQRFCTFTGAFFLLLHVILNIITLSIFAVRHSQPDGFVLSTAFWLTASSACVAFVVLVCLGIDFFLTDRFRTRGTGLSGKQRSLVVSFTLFLAVCCVSSIVAK